MNTSLIKKNLIPLLGILSGLVFFILLGIRLDIFPVTKSVNHQRIVSLSEKDSWMNIFRHDQKIGYSHRSLENTENGYRLNERTHLRLNIMGMVQDMRIKTEGNLNKDFSLSSFSFEMASGLFNFKAKGWVDDDVLIIQLDDQKLEFPLNEPIFLLSGILDAAGVQGLEQGETRAYYIFDPASLDRKSVAITLRGDETLTIMDKPVKTRKFFLNFMGIGQTAWVTEEGDVVKEEGLMGIRLVKADKKTALSGMGSKDMLDLTESISVASNKNITNQAERQQLTVDLSGTTDAFLLDGGRQRFENGRLTIIKEILPDSSSHRELTDTSYLNASPIIQANHPTLKQTVTKIVADTDSAYIKTKKIMAWISRNIKKRPVLSIPNALETLENKMGDCNEHAVLFAAMARAAGIPTQIEAGLVHMKGRFYYHAWNRVFLGDWITVDTLMEQIPADITHIRLIRGETVDQLNLIHAIDNLVINIPEQAND